ncbi:hypothetical protein [Spiroplasma diminutum]|uniref:HNH endonuclease n=1 Tax=Spiroplasma diminutum CUAS-1 TaxID=1276221 RepID=S5LVQ7_9MOLU|nr:hypothetical protein [Spiroplasma diminutum]AGR41909.1 hypothetical protein SDIMI_v3c02050 [Spiroplasma diminutum CUAS-1]
MAKILETGEIEFSKEDLKSAWLNSPILINKDANDFRMCFICKFFMNKNNFKVGELAWVCEFIDLKHFSLEETNLIAIHPECRELRHKDDCSKIVKKIKLTEWSAIE